MPPNNLKQGNASSSGDEERVRKFQERYEYAITNTSQLATTGGSEPIPLRTLTTLLNFERCATDPRFQESQLVHSTFADPSIIDRGGTDMQNILNSKPASVKQIHAHVFCTTDSATGSPSTNDIISTGAPQQARTLTFAQRETIYHESRGHDGCYKALALYQAFFELCPMEQLISIQIKKEAPVLVSPHLRQILEFKVKDPKTLMLATGMKGQDGPHTILTGFAQESLHSVVGFPGPGSNNADYFVDMSRMQFGEAGRGTFDELYFLGSSDAWVDSMDKVCGGLEHHNTVTHVASNEHTELMDACAARVWERWQNRENEGWCDYCGVGASARSLQNCGGCKEAKVQYCCKEHQVSAWKLHKYTCEKVKK